jgi:hypothetical protein
MMNQDPCRYFPSAALAAVLLVVAGCSVVRHETAATKSMFQTLGGKGGERDATNAVAELQRVVMRQADEYVGVVAEASDDFRSRVPTTEARDLAQHWKLLEATAAYINATGENPVVNAVDMLVLASLSRSVVEDYWVRQKFGAAALPLLEAHRRLETNAWNIAATVLSPAQQEEVRAMMQEYRREFPDQRYVAAARFPELAAKLGKAGADEEVPKPGSLLGMLYLNPLAGLDPATQAIQQTRLLAQRISYYAQRMTMLWSWQAELTVYQLAAQPESEGVLSNLTQVAQSTRVFARTAEGLPTLVNSQREAAINQIFDRLATAQTNLLAELADENAKLHGTLGEARQTLQAGSQMADSVNTALKSLDSFVRYVSPPQTNPVPATVDTNSHPFNVLDYGAAASQIGAMATNLTALLQAVNQSETQATRLSRQATADAKEVVSHAFRLGAVLILLLGVVVAFVIWIYRRASSPGGRPRA